MLIYVFVGTTYKGAIDDVDMILQILENCGYSNDKYYIHCDAALYGLIVPFINHVRILYFSPLFSFKDANRK